MITAEAIIDLKALNDNFNYLKSQAPNSKMIAVLKGNAYGHGATQIALALPQADGFGVARIQEGQELRHAGITQDILMLEGCFDSNELKLASKLGLQTVIHQKQQLDDFLNTPLISPMTVWLKIDSGMHRIGLQAHEVDSYIKALTQSNKTQGQIGFVSHFANADLDDKKPTQKQFEKFNQITSRYPGPKCIANSAGILYYPETHCEQTRAGIAIYGLSPCVKKQPKDANLKPVMSLKSKIIALREHAKGEPIGYGSIWTAKSDTKIGVVAMGYGDGFPRILPENTQVLVNNKLVPIVGRVSMDMLTIDLGLDTNVKTGDSVIFWNADHSVDILANRLGNISYDLIIKLTNRVKRTYINSSKTC